MKKFIPTAFVALLVALSGIGASPAQAVDPKPETKGVV